MNLVTTTLLNIDSEILVARSIHVPKCSADCRECDLQIDFVSYLDTHFIVKGFVQYFHTFMRESSYNLVLNSLTLIS